MFGAGLGSAVLNRNTPSDGELRVRGLEVVAGGVVDVDQNLGHTGVGDGKSVAQCGHPWPVWAANMAAMLGSLMVPT